VGPSRCGRRCDLVLPYGGSCWRWMPDKEAPGISSKGADTGAKAQQDHALQVAVSPQKEVKRGIAAERLFVTTLRSMADGTHLAAWVSRETRSELLSGRIRAQASLRYGATLMWSWRLCGVTAAGELGRPLAEQLLHIIVTAVGATGSALRRAIGSDLPAVGRESPGRPGTVPGV
jgi:hypothetical protein